MGFMSVLARCRGFVLERSRNTSAAGAAAAMAAIICGCTHNSGTHESASTQLNEAKNVCIECMRNLTVCCSAVQHAQQRSDMQPAIQALRQAHLRWWQMSKKAILQSLMGPGCGGSIRRQQDSNALSNVHVAVVRRLHLEKGMAHGLNGGGPLGGVPLTQRSHQVNGFRASVGQQLTQRDGRERREGEAHGRGQLQALWPGGPRGGAHDAADFV